MSIASVAQLDRASDFGSEGLWVRIPPDAPFSPKQVKVKIKTLQGGIVHGRDRST